MSFTEIFLFRPPNVTCSDLRVVRKQRSTISYTVSYGRHIRSIANHSVDVQEQFEQLNGRNFGDLLMKQWRREPLTVDEREYLKIWDGNEVVHFAAFGIYCDQGRGAEQPIDLLNDLLN